MNKISAVIICKNEGKNISGCLESVSWIDEIIVVDSFSTDKTFEIAKNFSEHVYQNEWKGYSAQRKFGLSKTKNNWIFVLDADERCTAELKNEILNTMNDPEIKGYYIPRKSIFLGKWIKHCGWYPDYKMRLFRKEYTGISDRLVHESYEVEGQTAKLKNSILHYTVTSLKDFIKKINNYSTLSAAEKFNKKEISFADIFFIPFVAFLQSYIFKKGFLDGIHGLMVSNFHMITKLLTYMKIYELQNFKSK